MQSADLTLEPQGLPWDWHLEPMIYPKALQFSLPVTSSASKQQANTNNRSVARYSCGLCQPAGHHNFTRGSSFVVPSCRAN